MWKSSCVCFAIMLIVVCAMYQDVIIGNTSFQDADLPGKIVYCIIAVVHVMALTIIPICVFAIRMRANVNRVPTWLFVGFLVNLIMWWIALIAFMAFLDFPDLVTFYTNQQTHPAIIQVMCVFGIVEMILIAAIVLWDSIIMNQHEKLVEDVSSP